MRNRARAFVLAVLTIVTTSVLGVGSAFSATLAIGAATALIVPGTGTPNANIVSDYMENATDRYIAPFVTDATNNPVCTSTNGCHLDGVDYPASFWPLGFIGNWCPGYQCDRWDVSVGTGVANLDTALHDTLDDTWGDIIIFGYSQGGAVVSNELRNLGDLTPEDLSRLSVMMIGNAYNPDGGIFTRLGFLGHVPGLDVTSGQATPVDIGIPMTAIGFQYDPVMYAPLYWGNPLALVNAVAALELVHGNYLTPNGNGPTDPIAYGYTKAELAEQLNRDLHSENFREDSQGNVYVMIPAKSLPIVDLVSSAIPAPLQPAVKPVADLVSPVLKVLIDLGYDWSGDPGTERWLSPLPFNPIQNWPAVGANLVSATLQGIQAFIGDLGGATSTLTPTTQKPVSTLAAAATTETLDNRQSLPKAALVRGPNSTAGRAAVETDTKPAEFTEETPVTKPESRSQTKPDGKRADDKKSGEPKATGTKTDIDKKADSAKKSDEMKVDTETRPDSHKTSDTDKPEDPGAAWGKAAA